MPDTRVEVLKEIEEWVIEPNSAEHLLWLHGPAGSGKSAIATSACQQLDKRADGRQYLGASFFAKRDDKYLHNATLVLPTIATDLADTFPAFGKAVATLLADDHNLTKMDAMRPQTIAMGSAPNIKP